MDNRFLISCVTAEKLYEKIKNLPIIDYHNHLSVDDINNVPYKDIYALWVKPDPYKHRAMRMCGVDEKYITGDALDIEKFCKWCETVPKLIGHPLSHWTKMELELLEIDDMPNLENAKDIYEKCNDYLVKHEFSLKSVIEKYNVEKLCPCVSIMDDLLMFNKDGVCVPSLRGDDVVNITVNLTGINSLDEYEKMIVARLEQLKNKGCKFTDHALDDGFKYYSDDGNNKERFKRLLDNKASIEDKERLSSYILKFLAEKYSQMGFVMQIHIGAQRYTSTRLRTLAGGAGGFATIGNSVDVISLTTFLDDVDKSTGLPKTILFTLNPSDNALISTLSGSYSKDGVSGLVTQGPAWWWDDHKLGIKKMLENNSVYGLLWNFIGMTTDSRSILSFVRHDYFRRILCSYLGNSFEKGEYICSFDELLKLAENMCYYNAKNIVGGRI